MEKLYFEKPRKGGKLLSAKKETVDFLLNYSKALSVTKSKNHQFETILN